MDAPGCLFPKNPVIPAVGRSRIPLGSQSSFPNFGIVRVSHPGSVIPRMSCSKWGLNPRIWREIPSKSLRKFPWESSRDCPGGMLDLSRLWTLFPGFGTFHVIPALIQRWCHSLFLLFQLQSINGTTRLGWPSPQG